MATSKQNIDISIAVLDKFSRPLTVLASRLGAVGQDLKDFGQTASLAITAPMLLAGGSFVKAAADAEEMENRFRAVFGDLAGSTQEFATSLSEAVGRSDIKIKDALSTFQGFAVGMGFSREASQQLSQSLTTLSLDFASFNNLSDGEAQQRFIAALSGSGEVLDRFGINIKDSALGLELQALGLAESSQKATEQEKAIARLSLITKSMTMQGATGDAIRTQESFTNQMKRLSDAFFDFRVQLGRDIIPALTGLVRAAGNALEWFGGLSEGTRRLILTFAGFLAVLGPSAFVIGTTITAFNRLVAVVTALRVASLALLGPWGLVIGVATTVAGVIGYNLVTASDKATLSSDELNKQITDLAPNFDMAAGEAGSFSGALGGLQDEAQKTAESIKKLQEQAAEVFKDVAADEADAKRDIAEAIIGQEEKVSDIKREIRDLERQARNADDADNKRSIADKLEVLREQLAIEQNALRSAADFRKSLRTELAEAERRADLSDFERTIEDIQRRRVARLEAQVARLQEIAVEIAAEKDKNDKIQASFAASQAAMRKEATDTTTHIVKEATEQRKALDRVYQRLDSINLGGSANSTPAFRIPGRATGGPVSAGMPYIVGEKGPELFVPRNNGGIVPNNRLGGSNININISGAILTRDAAEQMGDLIIRRLQLSSAV